MNAKRLMAALIVGFIFFFGSDFLIHGFWLRPDYAATAELWRKDSEMNARFGWMVGGHLLYVVAFLLIWAKGFADQGCIKCGLIFGFFMGLFYQSNTLITYVVTPLPIGIALKWFFSGILQALLLGIITSLVYKPASAPAPKA